jgi:hypothetical protein
LKKWRRYRAEAQELPFIKGYREKPNPMSS